MKTIACLLLFFISVVGIAQTNNSVTGNSVQTATGSINLFNAQSLQVEVAYGGPIQFSTVNSLTNGIEIPSYLRVTVVSSGLWMVDVKAVANTFLSNTTSEMPPTIMSLRRNTDHQFMPITGSGQVLLTSPNANIKNVIDVDARFQPGWTYQSGVYNTTLSFTLTMQ
jgi:hypothetical protein